MCFTNYTFYTTAQLQKFHRQFAHPSAGTLYNLLKKAGLEAVDAKTMEQLEDIVSRCEPCQRIRNAPLRFRVSMGHEDVRFNARAYIDIMYLDGRPVLHIVDEATRFSAARFLPKTTTDAVWEAIIMCWSSVYTGLPHYIMVDARNFARFSPNCRRYTTCKSRKVVSSHTTALALVSAITNHFVTRTES